MIVLAIACLIVMAGGFASIGVASLAVDRRAWPACLLGLLVAGFCAGAAVALALSPIWGN